MTTTSAKSASLSFEFACRACWHHHRCCCTRPWSRAHPLAHAASATAIAAGASYLANALRTFNLGSLQALDLSGGWAQLAGALPTTDAQHPSGASQVPLASASPLCPSSVQATQW